ncbi:MAG: type II CAAX endopeptidase family protein [Nitrososphaerota archaeon]|nr:CPBP family intramembrane metalloprotease [Candidatus Geocrenenecus dongiae]
MSEIKISEALTVWSFSMILLTSSILYRVEGYIQSTIINELLLAIPPTILLIFKKNLIKDLLKSFKTFKFKESMVLCLIAWSTSLLVTHLEYQFYPPPEWYLERITKTIPTNIQELSLALIVTWVFVAPIEEILFRWILLKSFINKLRRWTSLLLSSLIFSISHLDPWNFIQPFLIGLVAGYALVRYGSLSSAITIHGLYNSLTHIFNMLTI